MNWKKYHRVISVGMGCGPASMLKHYYLRDASYPFDWLTTPIDSLIEQLESDFSHFLLSSDTLSRRVNNARYIFDSASGISLQHDFTPNGSLEIELPSVREKYLRRYNRLAHSPGPVLFIRYVLTEEELLHIYSRLDDLMLALRKSNQKNDLLIIRQYDPTETDNKPKFEQVREGVELYRIDWPPAIQIKAPSLAGNRLLHHRMIFMRYPFILRLKNFWHQSGENSTLIAMQSIRNFCGHLENGIKRLIRPLISFLIGEKALKAFLVRIRSK